IPLDLRAVVIDTGMGHTRSGLAGDERPRSVVPSQGKDGSILTHGVVTDWDRLEELWHRIFYHELAVCPEELALLATDSPLSPIINREKVAELLFEGFGVPAMLVMPRSVLAAYSYGCTTGVVLGSGGKTYEKSRGAALSSALCDSNRARGNGMELCQRRAAGG
uniref:Uncharacterized protein n=1 Tax=Pavo cristatus TaxID=9049 RepID=A0A8C9LGM4_PAVCR